MNKRIAFIFPGQGSQYIGMGKDFYDNTKIGRELFDTASDFINTDIKSICFNGPEELLIQTENTQPAILIVSIIAAMLLKEKGVIPVIAAGHSLGEYSALVSAGAISFKDAVSVVKNRGRYMQDAVPHGVGAMAAIIGIDIETVKEICSSVSTETGVVQVANHNNHEQTVIAGHKYAVQKAGEIASSRGAKRVIPLQVSAPFHCILMKPAEIRLKNDLKNIGFSDLNFPIITNVDAKIIQKGEDALFSLERQVTNTVLWYDSLNKMRESHIDLFIEVGPGRVLSGLFKRIDRSILVENVEDIKGLNRVLAMV